MAALALGGERSAALAHYKACRRLLARELGCGPEDKTQALYAQIRDGWLSQPWPQPQSSPVIVTSAPPSSGAGPPYRFVAREQELAHLEALLDGALAGQGGAALIAGEAGAGLQASPDPKGLSRPLGSVLQELTREWGNILIDLDQADGQAFVEACVDSEPNRLGAGFRQVLYDHTDGNPLFTVELLGSFERDGTLVQDEAGRWVEAGGPDWERWPPASWSFHLQGFWRMPTSHRARPLRIEAGRLSGSARRTTSEAGRATR